MIINTISKGNDFVYRCNGVNDDIVLVRFVANLRSRGFNSFSIKVMGSFVKSATTAINIDNSGYSQITLDFSECNRITLNGAFLNIKNVYVKNCEAYHQNGLSDIDIRTFSGDGCTFENCRVTGAYRSGGCYVFNGDNNKIINCYAAINNNNGLIYGIYGTGLTVQGCTISVYSSTASAYGIEAGNSFTSDSRFRGETGSNVTTTSGNGGIGGGYFANCEFIGLGALKGQGFYLRSGYWLTVINCIFRGYTKNTSTGWGIGLSGQASDSNTLSLLGINCNQVTLSGFSQTKSMEFTAGYGAYIGTFYTAPIVSANIRALAAWNRNRT